MARSHHIWTQGHPNARVGMTSLHPHGFSRVSVLGMWLNPLSWLCISEKHLTRLFRARKLATTSQNQPSIRRESNSLCNFNSSSSWLHLDSAQSLLLLPPARLTLTRSSSGSVVARQPAASNGTLCCIRVMRKLGIMWRRRDY